ncbi:MAG: DUF1080 domain-containing protein [Planctomycetota bacterium]|nr:MAG: DUF1080 domain-containing protein [Planctomycetota bacterium]REK26469.1 MAG: DUF1080 domain-containing protein [Planctomycetota bacterium]REK38693.1 MAG: DUF1080 domain-containing protein [Planctomycetota bacterium]
MLRSKLLCLARPRNGVLLLVLTVATIAVGVTAVAQLEYQSGIDWPMPKVVEPGEGTAPPADAIVLFDGTDMSAWEGGDWPVEDGYFTPRSGHLSTCRGFGSCQLHLEWATPAKVNGQGQRRGNSGVKLMSRYEVQILDSYENETYPDGQAGAIYKQRPPLVNVCRPPGAWQSYDIIFHAPEFDAAGKLTKPATLTVLHNGVVIQDHFELQGETAWLHAPAYTAHGEKEPLLLQNHGNAVRFRNIWIREL